MKPMHKELWIEGEKIYLRPITIEDTELVVKWRNSENVVKNFLYRKPISEEEHIEWFKTKVQTGKVHQFIICGIADDMPLGSVYLQNFDDENKKAEYGIFIGKQELYGCGVGTAALSLLLKYGFDELSLHKIFGRVLSYNKASIVIAQKSGCVQEAYLKEEILINGKYEDILFMAKINNG